MRGDLSLRQAGLRNPEATWRWADTQPSWGRLGHLPAVERPTTGQLQSGPCVGRGSITGPVPGLPGGAGSWQEGEWARLTP